MKQNTSSVNSNQQRGKLESFPCKSNEEKLYLCWTEGGGKTCRHGRVIDPHEKSKLSICIYHMTFHPKSPHLLIGNLRGNDFWKPKRSQNFKIQCILKICMVKLSMNMAHGPCIHEYFQWPEYELIGDMTLPLNMDLSLGKDTQ